MSDSEILWTLALQAPLSMGCSRQKCQSRLPCPPPGDLPHPETEPVSLMSLALESRFFTTSSTWEAHYEPRKEKKKKKKKTPASISAFREGSDRQGQLPKQTLPSAYAARDLGPGTCKCSSKALNTLLPNWG